MPGTLQPIAPQEVETAHAEYLAVFKWLNGIGVRQWLVPVSLESFRARQQRGELLGYYRQGNLVAVVTVAREVSPYWLETAGSDPRWWIKTLIVPRQFGGTGVGAAVVQACEDHIRREGSPDILLDCVVTGFFPGYYAQAGYAEIARKDITYPSGNTFLVALMRKQLGGRAPVAP